MSPDNGVTDILILHNKVVTSYVILYKYVLKLSGICFDSFKLRIERNVWWFSCESQSNLDVYFLTVNVQRPDIFVVLINLSVECFGCRYENNFYIGFQRFWLNRKHILLILAVWSKHVCNKYCLASHIQWCIEGLEQTFFRLISNI